MIVEKPEGEREDSLEEPYFFRRALEGVEGFFSAKFDIYLGCFSDPGLSIPNISSKLESTFMVRLEESSSDKAIKELIQKIISGKIKIEGVSNG